MDTPFSVTTGMVGGGFYNRHSAPQMSAIDHVMPWSKMRSAASRLTTELTRSASQISAVRRDATPSPSCGG
jgi:hypothetical protein